MRIVIDTREQQPWAFRRDMADTCRGTLKAGDYALDGDDGFAVERKSLDDFVGTVSSGWDRFKRELVRMSEAQFPARVVIVEADWMDVIDRHYNHPEVSPHFVLLRLAELTLDGVLVLWCSNRTAAAGLCWKLLAVRERMLESE